jgi:TPR repeat protein
VAALYEAHRALRERQFDKALKLYQAIAEAGEPRGWYLLGYMHSQGLGVRANLAGAARFYRLAAEAGDADAAHNLGALYAQGRGVPLSYAEAIRWYRRGADAGDAASQHILGVMYATGQGLPVDYAEAARWWHMAAERGHPTAMVYLGHIHHNGDGVPPDPAGALGWYLQAWQAGEEQGAEGIRAVSGAALRLAQAGDADAAFLVGQLHELGFDGANDPGAALHWYSLAAEQDHVAAWRALGRMTLAGAGVAHSSEQAAAYFEAAARHGDAEAQAALAGLYTAGEGVAQDRDRGVELYRAAAEQGLVEAQGNLGALLVESDNQTERIEGTKWLLRAAQSGHTGAMLRLGRAYHEGIGGPPNLVQAARWIFAAIGNGNGDGIHDLHDFAREMTPEQLQEADRLAGGDGSMAAAAMDSRE